MGFSHTIKYSRFICVILNNVTLQEAADPAVRAWQSDPARHRFAFSPDNWKSGSVCQTHLELSLTLNLSKNRDIELEQDKVS